MRHHSYPLSTQPSTTLVVAPRIIRLKQVLSRVGISRAQLYALKKDGRFPQNFSLSGPGGRAVGWLESDIDEWVSSRVHMSVAVSKLEG